jgi:hypothetical protein
VLVVGKPAVTEGEGGAMALLTRTMCLILESDMAMREGIGRKNDEKLLKTTAFVPQGG